MKNRFYSAGGIIYCCKRKRNKKDVLREKSKRKGKNER